MHMSIQPEILKAIEIIDQRIESLKQIRDNLAREFGMDGLMKSPPAAETPLQLPFIGGEGKTSKDKIANFLRHNGPSSRKEIADGTGIPMGTVSYALNDKTRFSRDDHGWVASADLSAPPLLTAAAGEQPAEPENKTDVVRQYFRERGDRGLTPGELKDWLANSAVTLNAYAVIARLKKHEEIKDRNGRYYATEKLTLSTAVAH
jgi:hypothetical protein